MNTTGKVVVLEARELCSGATARNGGHIKPSPYESFSQFSKRHSKERAAALTRFRMRHLKCLIDVCKSEGIEGAEAREVETVDIFLDDVAFQKAVGDVEEMKRYVPDFQVEVWAGKEAQEVRFFILLHDRGHDTDTNYRNLASMKALLVHYHILRGLSGLTALLCQFGNVCNPNFPRL
jgi:hypothetical protein